MPTDNITREEVIKVARGDCRSISEVARNLGLCKGDTMDGRTGKRLRTLGGTELDLIIAGNRDRLRRASKERKMAKGNPYRPGSVYAVIFREGSKRFQTKDDLIKRIATMTGKTEQSIAFSLTVLSSKNHSSNGGRSTALRQDGGGNDYSIKLIALKPHG